jgi:hypothetical protein
VPALMLGAIDDILVHIRKIGPLVRMLIVGAAGFVAGELLHGLRNADALKHVSGPVILTKPGSPERMEQSTLS